MQLKSAQINFVNKGRKLLQLLVARFWTVFKNLHHAAGHKKKLNCIKNCLRAMLHGDDLKLLR